MLQKTTRYGKNGHYHIAYIRPDGVSGITSKNKGHAHLITLEYPDLDELGNPVGNPGLIAAEENGHTHYLAGDVDLTNPIKQQAEDDMVQEVHRLFKDAKAYEKESRQDAEECEDFYCGDQWEKGAAAEMEGKERTAVTINLIEPSMDMLSGYQRQNRSDIKYFPTENGDTLTADMMTEIVKNICERNDFTVTETEVQDDQRITGRGLYHPYIDHSKNLEGEVIIEKWEWDEAFFGPHNRLDCGDLEYLHKAKWFSKAKIEQMYPEVADDIKKEGYPIDEDDKEFHQRYEGEQYEKSSNNNEIDPDFVDIVRKEFRVIECERKHYTRTPVFVYADDNFVLEGTDWRREDIASVKTMEGFAIIYIENNRIRTTVVAGFAFISDEITDETEFSIIPVYAKKRKKKWWGKIKPALGAQDVINKSESQKIDILNKVAAYGWFHDASTFPNVATKKEFEEKSSSPGFNIEVTSVERPPLKTEGVRMPAEIIEMGAAAKMNLKEILNINPEMLGMAGQAKSGIAMIEQKKQGLIGNEFLFDNADFAKKQLGRRIVRLIQKCYTPERIVRVLMSRNKPDSPVMVAGQQVDRYPRELLMEALSNKLINELDIVVGQQAHSPTQQMNNFIVMLEAAQKGIMMPPEIMIENAPLPKEMKDRALQSLQQMQATQGEAEKRKSMVELAKTLGAKLPEGLATQIFQQIMGGAQGPQQGGMGG